MTRLILLIFAAYFATAAVGGSALAALIAIVCAYAAGATTRST